MPRRLLVPNLHPGPLPLPLDQAHHARDVLRLTQGEEVELFTADGKSALARLTTVNHEIVVATVEEVLTPAASSQLTIASAIPKGDRADWMIEKLSELGVARFIPLQTERSVVHPEGKGKLDRWKRIAEESAKQCRRTGVMQISPLITLNKFLAALPTGGVAAYLSTAPGITSLPRWLGPENPCLLIGPEGDWSPGEIATFEAKRLTPLTLGATILRVETAAIAAAAVVSAYTPL